MKCTANYYYNLKKSAFETDSPIDGKTNSLLYWQDEITAPAKLTAPYEESGAFGLHLHRLVHLRRLCHPYGTSLMKPPRPASSFMRAGL
jgi:hypothetical protein